MNPLMMNVNDTAKALGRSRRFWLAVVLGALAAFGPLTIDMYLPALPALARDMDTSTSLAQLSLTSCLLGISMGQLFAGSLSDVRGRRVPILVGLIFYTLSSIFCALTPSIWALIALRFIQGVAGSAGIVISRAVVRDLFSGAEMTRFYALLMLVNGVAPILAPIVGSQLMRMTSWRGVFLALSIVGVIMFLAVLFGLPETLPAERRSKGGLKNTLSTFRALISDRVFMGYALSQGFVFAAMFAYISGSPFAIQNVYGASPQMFSLFFAINGLGIILASQITGRLVSRVSQTKLFVSGIGLASMGGIFLLIMVLSGAGLPAVLLPLFVVVSSVGIVSTTGFSLAMQNYGHSAGSASALLGLLSFIFGGVAAPLVGVKGSHTAVPMGVVIAVAEISSFFNFVLLVRKKMSRK
jgi:DHA1 family bicyclomycin/chloramphenicol resistance-like MFS transporter